MRTKPPLIATLVPSSARRPICGEPRIFLVTRENLARIVAEVAPSLMLVPRQEADHGTH